METITRPKAKIDELPDLMRRLSLEPIPAEVLEQQRRLLAEAAKVRDDMEPLPGNIKDLIRKERGEDPLG